MTSHQTPVIWLSFWHHLHAIGLIWHCPHPTPQEWSLPKLGTVCTAFNGMFAVTSFCKFTKFVYDFSLSIIEGEQLLVQTHASAHDRSVHQ